MVKSSNGSIILNWWIKTHDGWIAGVEFLQETSQDKAQSSTAFHKKNINDFHIELGHPSKIITHATTEAIGVQVIGIFKPCENFASEKSQKSGVGKKAVTHSIILGEMLFFNISFPSTHNFRGKKHCLLVMKDSSNFSWSFFLEGKLDLACVMLGLVKNLKNKCNMQVQYLCCGNMGKNVAIEKGSKLEGLGMDLQCTTLGIPQQNWCIEWTFATLFNQVPTWKIQCYSVKDLWAEAANTTMLLKKQFFNFE